MQTVEATIDGCRNAEMQWRMIHCLRKTLSGKMHRERMVRTFLQIRRFGFKPGIWIELYPIEKELGFRTSIGEGGIT